VAHSFNRDQQARQRADHGENAGKEKRPTGERKEIIKRNECQILRGKKCNYSLFKKRHERVERVNCGTDESQRQNRQKGGL
jgi:hypothetical protein